jgi:hypothetical protein
MKKTSALLITIIILFSACQKTPEELVVQNKADGALEEAISVTAEPEQHQQLEELRTVKSVKESFPAKDEKVTISIDAEVVLPNMIQFPVVQIEPDEITLDFVEKAIDVLMEGKEVYEPRTCLTKGEIEEKVLKLQQILADPENSKSDGLTSGDPEIVAQTKALFENRIQLYLQQHEDAPAEYCPERAVLQFMPAKYYEDAAMYEERAARWEDDGDSESVQLIDQYENGQKIVVDADLDGGYYGRLTVSNYKGEQIQWSKLYFIKSQVLNQNIFAPMLDYENIDQSRTSLTEEEALAKMADVITAMGFENMVLFDYGAHTRHKFDENNQVIEGEDTIFGYYATFQRQYSGVKTIDNPHLYVVYENLYAPRYDGEYIYVNIVGDEIAEFIWKNPVKQIESENTNVELISFDKIIEAFKAQTALEYNMVGMAYRQSEDESFVENFKSGLIHVTKMELGMVRIAIRDQPGKYRMVPAWKFYGFEHLLRKDEQNAEELTYSYEHDSLCEELLTINAVDGTVIDAELGY